jgi:endonuclease III
MRMTKALVQRILQVFAEMFPDAHCELHHRNPFELVIAVLLSAQCTDQTVNKVTATLFEKYRTPQDYLAVTVEELMEDIRQIGLFRNKAKHIQQLCMQLIMDFQGEVPQTLEQLQQLAGVGRKTANVVISTAFGVPAMAVDTHVERISKRLGFVGPDADVREVEEALMKKIPKSEWTVTHHRMIFFGRYHCKAQKPNCEICPLMDCCREGKQRLKTNAKINKNGN